ncbi:hypothetical protein [Nonomuraea guangzhouensis]|uniref:Secreted protein n=1 Tax=Nonomuraea guangzhouensis TaxID=1291555 RepID=A0ABW4GER8_9ACTN|nr:hypothetical protein [Nonomuraea guangzhouensis]
MDRRKAGLAAGMVAVLVLGGSGALAASPQPSPTGEPCAQTVTCSPADLAKLKEQAAKDDAIKSDRAKADDPGKDAVDCTTGMREPGSVDPQKRADDKQPSPIDSKKLTQALADALGVGLDRAATAADGLIRLGEQGGIRPDSPEFAAVAERLGVSTNRLKEALTAFKLGHAPKDLTPSPATKPGS